MKVIHTVEAIQDLEKIEAYLSQFGETAEKRINQIRKEIKILERSPNIGTQVKSRVETETDERYLVCDKRYLVFYMAHKDRVEITRITDGRTNWQGILFGGES